jgi:hypothetical protein
MKKKDQANMAACPVQGIVWLIPSMPILAIERFLIMAVSVPIRIASICLSIGAIA